MGLDEDNEIINSCVVIETGEVNLEKKPTFGKWAQMLIDEAKLQLKACTQVTSDDLINAVFDTLEPHFILFTFVFNLPESIVGLKSTTFK